MLMWSESVDMPRFYSTPLLPRAELMFIYTKRDCKQALADICENKTQGKA